MYYAITHHTAYLRKDIYDVNHLNSSQYTDTICRIYIDNTFNTGNVHIVWLCRQTEGTGSTRMQL